LVRPTLVALGLVVVGSLVELYLPLHSIVVTVVGLGIVVVGCSYFFVHYLEWRHAFMTVTTKRILLEKGVFTTSTRAIPLSKIDDVACKQSLLGKIFNFGGLTIDNANLEGGEALACVADPLSVRRLITNTTSAPKQTPPQAPSPTYDHPAQASSLVDELERLARLYSDGFITLVEFEASKARLLRDR
jgi:putative membrane protein